MCFFLRRNWVLITDWDGKGQLSGDCYDLFRCSSNQILTCSLLLYVLRCLCVWTFSLNLQYCMQIPTYITTYVLLFYARVILHVIIRTCFILRTLIRTFMWFCKLVYVFTFSYVPCSASLYNSARYYSGLSLRFEVGGDILKVDGTFYLIVLFLNTFL